MRLLVTGAGFAAMLVFTGAASSATSYSDAIGDANTPADISTIEVSESDGRVAISVEVANFRALPSNSSLTLWLDSDANPGTGNSDGREALVRYDANGTIALQAWSGTRLVERAPTGISATFDDQRLSLSAPGSTLGITGPFGLLVVSSRGQPAGNGQFMSADLAPDSGLMTYSGSGVGTFRDGTGDHESAPDIGGIAVSDAADGWVGIAIDIPNADALPRAPLVGVSVDADDDARTGEGGADLAVTALGMDVVADRWHERAKSWVPADGARVRVTGSGDTVTVGIHTSELGASARFGFAVLAAGVAGASFTGVDVAPDGAARYRYAFQSRPRVKLVASTVRTSPARPRPGSRLTVSARVTRSDTGAAARSGDVTCRARIDGKRATGVGVYAGGRASCTFRVPRTGRRIAGALALRADGITTTIPFSSRLR